MFEEILELLEDFATQDPREFASFRAMVSLRDKITAEGKVTPSMAGQIASRMKIELPDDLTDEQLEQLMVPIGTAVNASIQALIDEGFDGTSIINVVGKLEMTLG